MPEASTPMMTLAHLTTFDFPAYAITFVVGVGCGVAIAMAWAARRSR